MIFLKVYNSFQDLISGKFYLNFKTLNYCQNLTGKNHDLNRPSKPKGLIPGSPLLILTLYKLTFMIRSLPSTNRFSSSSSVSVDAFYQMRSIVGSFSIYRFLSAQILESISTYLQRLSSLKLAMLNRYSLLRMLCQRLKVKE